MSTIVSVTETVTTVTDNTTNVSVTASPSVVEVAVSTGPITIDGTSYSTLSGAGSPVGSATPTFAGQLYLDTDTDQVFVSFALDNSSWIELVRNY